MSAELGFKWGSEFTTSYQKLESEWYMCRIGNHFAVSRAAQILVCEVLTEEDEGIRCPNNEEILVTMHRLSRVGGIPTLMTDTELDAEEGWTGGPVTSASLVGALKINCTSPEHGRHLCTVLITSTKMVRVHIETSSTINGNVSAKQRAELAAGVMRAFGNVKFHKCQQLVSSGVVGIDWNGHFFTVDPEDNELFLRFGLWDNHVFKNGLWVGRGGPGLNEKYFA